MSNEWHSFAMPGLETHTSRIQPAACARVIGVFSYRYDAHLVPALIENLSGVVHGWAAFDDRRAKDALSDEPTRRNLLLAAARDMGADWILAVDPDERFEATLAERIGELTAAPPNTRWSFELREMFTPDAYRVDGLWGRKKAMRLFPCLPALNASPAALHGGWIADNSGVVRRSTGINLYHLNMISPQRRQRRRDLYAAADPERAHQAIGYDYLVDERDAVLEEIPAGREYHPPHRDDGRLWSAPGGLPRAPVPDSPANRLHLIAAQRAAGDTAGAYRVARDLADAAPGDSDLQLLTASAALDARQTAAALAAAEAAAAADPQSSAAHLFMSRALAAQGRLEEARAAAKDALRCAPGSLLARQQAAMLRTSMARFKGPGALWRRWTAGPARLREGARVDTGAELAVVVLAFRAPAALRAAVASVCAQEPGAEIVVVNSGGVSPRRLLAPHLDRIRLIEVAEPLFVGAIRNIGVDASTAPFVAFLAADCIARPGWVAQRLALHRAGAEAVSSPVIPHRPRNPISRAANALMHRRRRRDTPDAEVSHYGVSYARPALVRTGYFPPGLRVSEDTVFNGWLRQTAVFRYGRNVVTLHRYPTGPLELLRDARARGARRVPFPPYGTGPGGDPGAEPDWERLAQDSLAATLAVLDRAGAKGWRQAVCRWLLQQTIRAGQRGTQSALASAREAVRLREQAALAAVDDDDAALALADRALALDPRNLRCLMLCARLRLQRAAGPRARGTRGDREEAMALLRRAVALAPNGIGPLAALCAALKAAGRSAEAVDVAELHALSAPRSARLWVFAAKTAEKARQFRRSRLMWQMALVAGPQLAEPHQRLSRRHEREGQAELARIRREMGEALETIRERQTAGR